MKYQHLPSSKRKAFALLVILGTFLGSSPAASAQYLPLLRKQATVNDPRQSQAGLAEVRILLNGLQPDDVINLRPNDEGRIAVAAGAVARREEAMRTVGPMGPAVHPGVRLPDEVLEVGPRGLVFNRPKLLNQVVFVDIQVPRRSLVHVQTGGQTLLRAAVREPLALRNQAWAHGSPGVPGTLARAAGLFADTAQVGEVTFDESRGGYVAPARLLTIRRRQPLQGEPGAMAVVALTIDETGRVTRVVPLASSSITNLEASLMKWRFAPVQVEGRAVPVTTLMQVTADS